MIHEEKKKGGRGGETPKEKKKASQERQKCLGNNFQKHLDHPFTVMQPFVLQHTCTRTQTHKEEERRKKLNAEGEVMSITSTLLMTGWTNQVKKKHSELAKASISIFKAFQRGGGGGGRGGEDLPRSFGCQTTL